MCLVIEMPRSRLVERTYITRVLIGDFLGLSHRLELTDRRDVKISLVGEDSCILMPDCLLSKPSEEWLTTKSLPSRPVKYWQPPISNGRVRARPVPVIYGELTSEVVSEGDAIPLDIFGSAFFMLSRYEEIVIDEFDDIGRHHPSAAIAFQESFLGRAVVNEYLNVLWDYIEKRWPRLKRRERNSRKLISCDVDLPFSPRRTLKQIGSTIARDIIRQRDVRLTVARALSYAGLRRTDPFNSFDWMMDINERANNRLAFYMLSDCTDAEFDGEYDLLDPEIVSLMAGFVERGHEVGIHGSFNTFDNNQQYAKEVGRFQQAMSQINAPQDHIGNRQHYLRWRTPTTASVLNDCGISYDSTLGYAQTPGFRCGVCYEFPFFDAVASKELALRERPLLVMDVSVFGKAYLGRKPDADTFDLVKAFLDETRLYQGDFTLLWHNSELISSRQREFFKAIAEA